MSSNSSAMQPILVPLLPAGFLNDTFGAVLIGVYASIALWGVTCCQTFLYGVGPRFAQDPLWLKAFIFLVWLLDTTQQGLVCHVAYNYLATHFGDVAHLNVVVNTIVTEVLFNALIALTVKLFYTHRIWILSESKIYTIITFFFVIAEFIVSLIYTIKAYGDSTFAEITRLKGLSLAVNATGAAGDILIAAILCYILHSRKTGFKSTDTTITKLMAFIINTGLLTSICALLSLITISARPNAFIYIAFYFCLGRLYTNSLLATLNARDTLRSSVKDDYRLGTLSNSGIQRMRTGRPEIDIRITQTTSYDPGDMDVKRAQSNEERAPSGHHMV